MAQVSTGSSNSTTSSTSASTSASFSAFSTTNIHPGESISTSANASTISSTNTKTGASTILTTLLAVCDASVLQVQQDLSEQLLGRLEGNRARSWESGMAQGRPPDSSGCGSAWLQVCWMTPPPAGRHMSIIGLTVRRSPCHLLATV